MIPREEILSRIQTLAKTLSKDYEGKRPVMLCVLKGACPFYQHLLDALQDCRQGYTMEFLRVSSYHGTESTGKVKISGGLKVEDLKGKDVIIVEDIIDTGTTLSQLIPILQEQGNPKTVEVCTLLSKRIGKPAAYTAKYVGFSIPCHFIIGYGLDYNEIYRDLRDIWVISQKGIDFDQSEWAE